MDSVVLGQGFCKIFYDLLLVSELMYVKFAAVVYVSMQKT